MNSHRFKQGDQANRIIKLTHYFILVTLIVSGLLYSMSDIQASFLIYPVCVVLVLLSIWLLWSWHFLTKSLFDPYSLFIISASLFHGGQVYLELLHLNPYGLLGGRFSSETLLETLFLVLLGMTSFHFGALLNIVPFQGGFDKRLPDKKAESIYQNRIEEVIVTAPTNHSSQVSKQDVSLPITRYIRLVGWGLLLISIFPFIYILKERVYLVVASGYSALYAPDAYSIGYAATPQLLATFLVPAALFLLAGSEGKPSIVAISSIMVAGYVLLYLALGKRGEAVMPLIAYGWLYHRCIRPIPRLALLSLGATLLLVVFPLVRAVRNISGGDRFSLSFLYDTYLSIDNPLIAIISEMGSSLQTVAWTLDLVPSFKKFDVGMGYLYALLTVFPNFFWKVHPTITRGLPSTWLVWIIDPFIAALGGGLGFSYIAEAYLNFGWFGTPLALGFMGFCYTRLVRWSDKPGHPARMALMASFLAFVLFYPRQEIASQVRFFVWYSLLPYLAVYVIRGEHFRRCKSACSATMKVMEYS